VYFAVYSQFSVAQSNNGVIILNEPGWPLVFDLDPGENQQISRRYKNTEVKTDIRLISIKPFIEPNYWFPDSLERFNYYQYEVRIKIGNKNVLLYYRPYQMPATHSGLRVYVENIRQKQGGTNNRRGDMSKQVRFSVCLENEPWGTEEIEFPINDYLWRAAVYNNSWFSLVPFNSFAYYHRGEDYGAIPDKLDLVAPVSGKIVETPLPDGDGRSSSIVIDNEKGLRFSFAHMNIETINRDFPVGTSIQKGTVFAKTGMTWNGGKNQHLDPHVHMGIRVNNVNVSTYPFLMESYLKKYPDEVIAVAGGYRFATIGKPIVLDAGRSISRDNSMKYVWHLSDGRTISERTAEIKYDKPGIYSEELIVSDGKGEVDRDFLYVRVFDHYRGRDIAFGWAYYYPVRNIKPGTELLFWDRLVNTSSPTEINFGDTQDWQVIKSEITHKYQKPGRYVVTYRSLGVEGGPLCMKMEVIVD
jgi:murein DD-endopeptidase MepM/ murein hydrolase activator NlpD